MAKYVKRCPKCGSDQIEYMMQERKSFNGCVGCIGWLIAWPFVLLGFVGKKGNTTGTVATVDVYLSLRNKKAPRSEVWRPRA